MTGRRGIVIADLERDTVLDWEAACESADGFVRNPDTVRALVDTARAHPSTAERIFEALARAEPLFRGRRMRHLLAAMEGFAAFPGLAPRAYDLVAPYEASRIRAVARQARRTLEVLRGAVSS